MWICNEMCEGSQRLLQKVLFLVLFQTRIAVELLALVCTASYGVHAPGEKSYHSWDLICYPEIVVTVSFRCYVSLSALTYRNTCETLTDTWSKLSVWFTTPADLSHAVKPQNDIYNCSLCLCPGDLCAYSLQIYHIFLRRHESVPQPVCPGLAWLWLWYLLDWPIKKPPPSFYFPLCFRSPKYWALNRICLNDLLRN